MKLKLFRYLFSIIQLTLLLDLPNKETVATRHALVALRCNSTL